jgi:peptidyl-prolyl cis-trans isomerase D
MLQTMRHLAQSWVFKALMLFLIVSFCLWGIGDIFRGNPLQRTIAKVGKLSISVETLDHSFQGTLARARQMLGPELTAQQARQMGIYDQTLNELIEHAEVEQQVSKLGLEVSDKEFLGQVAAMPQFRNPDGSFNRDLFRRAVTQSDLSERSFIDRARKEMAQQQLLVALHDEPKIPDTIADSLYRARGQKRILDVVSVKDNAYGDVPAPDDKALQDFYQKNSQQFMAPEYRGLTIARLATDDVAKDIAISDADLKKAYGAKSAGLAQPERRDLVQVVLHDEDKAKQLAVNAKKSDNLAEAAKSAGLSAVALNATDAKSMLPELAKSVFAMPAGQISDPIKTALGWHVIEVKKIIPSGTPDFDSLKDSLRDSLKRDQAIESVTREVNDLDDQLAAGHSLEDIADDMKLRLIKIPALDAEGKTPDGKDPAELPDRADVLKAAFSQGSGEVSPILDDKQGNYVVVRTDQITPAAVPAFEKIRDHVAAAWIASEAAKRAAAAADAIAKGMREGKPASSFAAQAGVDVRVSKPISILGDNDPDLSQEILPQIFKLKKGDVITVPLEGRQLVLRLAEFVDADPKAEDATKAKLGDELANQLPNDRGAEYAKYLRILMPVEIDESLLETLRQQGGS